MTTDPRVDDYLESLIPWQRKYAEQVRKIVHVADQDVQEVIKRSVQPYFVLDGNICALLSAKDHLNIFIYDPNVADPDGLINQGEGNKTARSIQLYEGDELDEAALLSLFKEIIRRNRAGGWRVLG